MTVNIPTSFKIGRYSHTVQYMAFSDRYRGHYYPSPRVVVLVKDTKPRMEETFWHEATHAILHSMDHPLRSDEAFVEGFSTRLYQLIRTAKFDGTT